MGRGTEMKKETLNSAGDHCDSRREATDSPERRTVPAKHARSSLDTAHGNPLFLNARRLARKKESRGVPQLSGEKRIV